MFVTWCTTLYQYFCSIFTIWDTNQSKWYFRTFFKYFLLPEGLLFKFIWWSGFFTEREIDISEENKRLLVRCVLVNCEPGNGTNYRYQMVIMLITAIFSSCWDSPNIKCQHTASSPASWLEQIQRRYIRTTYCVLGLQTFCQPLMEVLLRR